MKTSIYWQDPKCALGQPIIQPGYVLNLPLYRLDGAAFMSQDAYGHLCTVTGAQWRPEGRYFDGLDDWIGITDSPAMRVGISDITICTWVRYTEVGLNVILDMPASGWYRLSLETHIDTGRVRAHINTSAGTTLTEASRDINDGNWHSVIAVYDRDTSITLYLDGAPSGIPSGANTGDLQNAYTSKLAAGGGYDGGISFYFNVYIGELLIYKRALTAAEVQHNYLATKWRYQK